MTRYNKLDQKFKQENQDLTDEYKRLTRQFKDLQDKHSHFELADEAKFREVWTMNETDAKEMMSQILDCDRIITEQQLGLIWSRVHSSDLLDAGGGNLLDAEDKSETGTQTGKSKVSQGGQ